MKTSRLSGAFRVAAIYAIAAGLWILLSDKILFFLAPDHETAGALSMYKGWAFVAVTAWLLYWERKNSEETSWGAKPVQPSKIENRLYFLIAVLLPFLTLGLQWILWSYIAPFVWFLFYPTVFISAWIGGSKAGLISTVLSAAVAWYFFIPPQLSWEMGDPNNLFSVMVFVLMGYLFSDTHERLRAANRLANIALGESEERFDLVLQTNPNAMLIVSKNGRIERVNAQAEKTFGYETGTLKGVHIGALVSEELKKIHETIRMDLPFNPHQIFPASQQHLRGHRRDGSEFPAEISLGLMEIKGEKYVIATVADITERKQAEQALQESERRYRTLFEDTPIAIWEEDFSRVKARLDSLKQQGVTDFHAFFAARPDILDECAGMIEIADVNNSALQMYKAKSKKELLESTRQNTSRGEQEHLYEVFTAIEDGRTMGGWDGEDETLDGEPIHISLGWSVVPGYEQDYSKIIVTTMDITGRKQAEEKLRESEEKYRILIEQIPAIVYIDDATAEPGRTVYVSPQVEDKLGVVKKDWMDGLLDFWSDHMHPEDRDQAVGAYMACFQNGTPMDVEYRMTAADGSIIWFRDQAILQRDGNGAPLLLHGLMYDITARKQAEEEINRLNVELEQRVIERTAQLSAANKELEAFTYSVSHDLRAPLRAIDGYTRILMEDYESALDAEGRGVCDVIRGETQRMGRLIDDLLNLSRLGRTELQAVPIDMASMARSVFEGLMMDRSRGQVDFTVGEMPPIQGDPVLMRQVWINLLNNAIKFTSKKDRAVIEVGGFQDEGESVFFVRDNGAGFDMQYENRLFGVFQRLHSNAEFEGTGVGLAIVQRVIHRHGGRVWAEGKMGEGAAFYFALPHKP